MEERRSKYLNVDVEVRSDLPRVKVCKIECNVRVSDKAET